MENQLCSCGKQYQTCICDCCQFYFCDTCLENHISSYPDYFHFPIPLYENPGPFLKEFFLGIHEQLMKKIQIKQKLINEFIFQTLNMLNSLKSSAFKEENEMQAILLASFTGKSNKEDMQKFKNFVKSNKLSYSAIENDTLEEKIREMKNSIIESIKNLEEHSFCYSCSKLSELITLDCKHKLCKDCFVNLVKDQTDSRFVLNVLEYKDIVCTYTNCFSKISDSIQERNVPDYDYWKQQANERIDFTCSKCRVQGKFEVFQTSCHHYCESCTIELIRSGKRACPDCEVLYTNEELRSFAEKRNKCEGCFEVKNWIKEFPRKLCKHFVCIQCLEDSSKSQQCFISDACPNFNLNPVEFEQLLKVKCSKCPAKISKSNSYWFNKNCQCFVCEDCQLNFTNNDTENCLICRIKFNKKTQIILDKRRKDNLIEPTKQCPVCEGTIKVKDMISLTCCIHEFCKICCSGYVNACVGDISQISKVDKCMVCNEEIKGYQLEKVIGLEAFTKLTFYILQKQQIDIIPCPKCKEEFDPGFQRKVECIHCKYVFCKQCKDAYHESGNCQEVFLQQRIKEMENMEGGVTQCPRCRFPYIKDPKNCEHADCLQPGCGVSFCFQCGCLRSPTLEHGNHYHRKECKFYAPIDPEFINQHKEVGKRDCSECKRLGYKHLGEQHCPPPKSLRLHRRVDPDEVE